MTPLSLKNKIIIASIALLTAFAFGRYSVSTAPTVKTEDQTKIQDQKASDKDTHTQTTITTTKQPNGTVQTVEKIDVVTTTKSTEKKDTQEDFKQTITPLKQSKVNISILAANDFSKVQILPTYGLSVNKEILGPITVGAFGFTNGTIGLSLGLNF